MTRAAGGVWTGGAQEQQRRRREDAASRPPESQWRRALLALCLLSCSPGGPREVRGPGKGDGARADAGAPALPSALLVVGEHAERGGHLVVLDEEGRRQRNLTPPPTDRSADASPAVSPDGRWVAFASSRERTAARDTSIWIVAADGSSPPRRLTGDEAIDVTPAFAPDGRTLAFGSTRGGDLDIWLLDLDGEARPAGAPRRLTATPDAEYQPAFSRRGDLLAWTALATGGAPRVRVARVDGSGGRDLVAGAGPEFAPDDATVAFAARPAGREDLDLFTVPVGGGAPVHLADEPLADESGPRYSADGRFLFASAVVRDGERRALVSNVLCLELADPALRALVGPLPISRLGVALGPGVLDAARLRANPLYREALRRAVLR